MEQFKNELRIAWKSLTESQQIEVYSDACCAKNLIKKHCKKQYPRESKLLITILDSVNVFEKLGFAGDIKENIEIESLCKNFATTMEVDILVVNQLFASVAFALGRNCQLGDGNNVAGVSERQVVKNEEKLARKRLNEIKKTDIQNRMCQKWAMAEIKGNLKSKKTSFF